MKYEGDSGTARAMILRDTWSPESSKLIGGAATGASELVVMDLAHIEVANILGEADRGVASEDHIVR